MWAGHTRYDFTTIDDMKPPCSLIALNSDADTLSADRQQQKNLPKRGLYSLTSCTEMKVVLDMGSSDQCKPICVREIVKETQNPQPSFTFLRVVSLRDCRSKVGFLSPQRYASSARILPAVNEKIWILLVLKPEV